jgi:chorismate mutase/prephenate dehydrogenase
MSEDKRTEIDLPTLREEIKSVDSQLADLLISRQHLARQVIDYKVANNIPLRNYSVESQVIDRFTKVCRQYGEREEWGVAMAATLIKCSVELQGTILDARTSHGSLKSVVVGGVGRMGQWLCNFLNNQGHTVFCSDSSPEPSMYPRVDIDDPLVIEADIVIIAVPMEQSADVLQKLIERKPSGVLIDIASMKRDVLPAIKSGIESGLKITSIHQLFGSDATTLYDKNLVICPCGSDEADDTVRALFQDTAVNIREMPPEEHDAFMTITLGMSHAINLIFAHALSISGNSKSDYQAMASATFAKQMLTTNEVVDENMELYFDIQQQCDYETMYSLIGQSVEELFKLVRSDDRQEFLAEMKTVKRYFNDGPEA